jgi:hypothetical protein
MAHKEHLKKAVPLPGGGFQWAWDGTGGVRHTVDWAKSGETTWTVWFDGTALRSENPWFLVRSRGEVQENIKYFRLGGLDLIHANRALLGVGIMPDQHQDQPWCNCGRCVPVIGEDAAE